MRRHLKHLLVATSLALAASAGSAPVAAAPVGCSTEIETLNIDAQARRSSYRIGQTALVDVLVTDRLTGMPESDIHSGILLQPRHKKKVVMDIGRTDERGHVLLRLKLTDDGRVKPGKTEAGVGAWDPVRTPLYCGDRYGYRAYDNLFRIRR